MCLFYKLIASHGFVLIFLFYVIINFFLNYIIFISMSIHLNDVYINCDILYKFCSILNNQGSQFCVT